MHYGLDCQRRLDVSPRAASRALLQMRVTGDFHRRWSLGSRGSFEIDGDVVELETHAHRTHAIHLPGRVWSPNGSHMARVDAEVHSVMGETDDAVEVTVSPAQRLPEWFRANEHVAWLAIAQAALDELCEEVLWRASRDEPAATAS